MLLHFVPVAVATTGMLLFEDADPLPLAVTMALVLWTVTVWGGLFEGRWWALPAEAARLVVVGAAATAALLGTPWSALIAPVGLAVGASLLWLLHSVRTHRPVVSA